MLIEISGLSQLDMWKLLDIYSEGIRENAEEFYPDEDVPEAIKKEEASFREFLCDFFEKPGNTYWILSEDGVWVSALRLSETQEGFYYLEALETRPDSRRMGYAAKLIGCVIERLKIRGPFRICDCVSKRNLPSVRTHEKCGFKIVSEEGFDYLRGTSADWEYGFEFRYDGAEIKTGAEF